MLVEAEFECGLTEFAARAIFLASPLKMTAEVIARARQFALPSFLSSFE